MKCFQIVKLRKCCYIKPNQAENIMLKISLECNIILNSYNIKSKSTQKITKVEQKKFRNGGVVGGVLWGMFPRRIFPKEIFTRGAIFWRDFFLGDFFRGFFPWGNFLIFDWFFCKTRLYSRSCFSFLAQFYKIFSFFSVSTLVFIILIFPKCL